MIDIPSSFTNSSVSTFCFLIMLYLAIVLVNWKRAFKLGEGGNGYTKEDSYAFMYMAIGVLLILEFNAFEGDYFRYIGMIKNYASINGGSRHMEAVYGVIASLVGSNFLLFRFIVWGGSFLLLIKVFKKFGVDKYISVFLFFSLYFISFFISRSCLALSIYFLGFWFFTNQERRGLGNRMLGVALIVCSYFFHKSVFFLIVVTPAVFLPLDRKTLLVFLILFPALVYGSQFLFNSIVEHRLIMNKDVMNKIIRFTEFETPSLTAFGYFRSIFSLGVYYVPFAYISHVMTSHGSELEDDREFANLYKITFCIFMIATSIGFLNLGAEYLFTRTLWLSSIPLTIMLAKLYRYKLMGRDALRNLMVFGQINAIYTYLYGLYSLIR